MPNHDSGAYFFTALFPVDATCVVTLAGEPRSPVQLLRETLQFLPTALQTKVAEDAGVNSPFARSTRTHFVRLFVIDDAAFNGRPGEDTMVSLFKGRRTIEPGEVDQLNCPYLVMAAEFDPAQGAAGAGPTEPHCWLEEIWAAMPELKEIFSRCRGFDTISSASEFANLAVKCQVETTMPFHDYWPGARGIESQSIWTALAPFIAAFGFTAWLWLRGDVGFWAAAGLFRLLCIPAVIVTILWMLRAGRAPLPGAPGSRLQDVLKALYLQQHATGFAVAAQGMAAGDLHAAFGAFIATHQPANAASPTQTPGVIKWTPPGSQP